MSVRQVIPLPGVRDAPVSYMAGLRLVDKAALVVGGGAVAAQRVRGLLAAGARVHLVAPRVGVELATRAAAAEITWEQRCFLPRDIDGVVVVLVAIDDPIVSAAIARYARSQGVWVNVADRPELCDFYLPAIHRAGHVQVAVSTDGVGPGLAARLRDEIRDALPPELPAAVEHFGELRRAARAEEPDARRRMARLAEVARTATWAELAGAPAPAPGLTVVSAGPGDPRLLTLAAREALRRAQFVVADRLVPGAILALTRGRVVRAGDKHRAHDAELSQETIYAELRAAVTRGEPCVRLCAGDAAIFGRLAETVTALHPLRVEVIPGVSALTASGHPLTARGLANRFVVVTARGAGGTAVDLPRYEPRQTLVLFMGAGALGSLREALLHADYPAGTPVLAVSQASQASESRRGGTVNTLVTLDVPSPAVLLVGGTAALGFGARSGPTQVEGLAADDDVARPHPLVPRQPRALVEHQEPALVLAQRVKVVT